MHQVTSVWHDRFMVVTIILAIAAVAVLAAIVVVATGGGGELSVEHPDHPPLALPGRRAAGGTDAALLRLPMGLWGYHKQITDEALERFAHELTERDTRIAVLEQELAEARQRAFGDDRPETAQWRPAVPAAAPPPEAAPDTLVDMPADPHAVSPYAGEPYGNEPYANDPYAPAPYVNEPHAGDPQRTVGGDGEPAAPPATIQDRVVFDPRQAARSTDAASAAEPAEPAEPGEGGADDAARRPERRTADGAAPWTPADDRDAYGGRPDPGAGAAGAPEGRAETGARDEGAPWARPASHTDLAGWATGAEHTTGAGHQAVSGAHDMNDEAGEHTRDEPGDGR